MEPPSRETPAEAVRRILWSGIGVPNAWDGAVRVEAAETATLAALAFDRLLFGWSGPDDMYVVPDHAKQFMRISHTSIIIIEFAEEKRVAEVVKRMEAKGLPLPTEPPHDVIKWQPWMTGERPRDDPHAASGDS
jgi:hypothetical protein